MVGYYGSTAVTTDSDRLCLVTGTGGVFINAKVNRS